jgi:HAE1 family hydrophobic/amphiphilic exporter-1
LNISEGFIRRPIATSLLMLGIGCFGVLAYRQLPVSDLPNVDYPTIQVSAGLTGSDPGTMASAVATPLERQFTSIAGLDDMTSGSSTGSSSITLQFSLDKDLESAASDVQTQIAAAMPLLPAGMPAPPTFRKTNPADQSILSVGLISKSLSLPVLDDYAENVVAPRLAMVSGVAQVQVNGQQKYAVRVQVDPEKLKALQIGINEVDQALQSWNVTTPTGQLYGRLSTYNINVDGQLANADAFGPVVVAYRQGRPVHLRDIARVIDSVENNQTAAWLYTPQEVQREIFMTVIRQPGTNTVEIIDSIRALIPTISAQLPPSAHLMSRRDPSRNIREAFSDLRLTIIVTFILVVAVIFVFLRNASATVIPALALPFSMLGTFGVMRMLNYNLDNLSMMALILCLGFVVDDAIVMIENIVRHLEAGEPPLQAALNGSKEIVFTILTMTVSLVAVFVPILFMSGILGRLFREFAVTITVAILISGLVSITLTPMLCSRFLKVGKAAAVGGLNGLMERGFDAWFRLYAWSLDRVLRHRVVMLLVFVGVLFATVKMFGIVPKGFIPDQDNDTLNIQLKAAQGTSFYEMAALTQKAAALVVKNPYVYDMFVQAGGGAMNTGQMNVNLVPRKTRPLTSNQIAAQIRPLLAAFPQFRATVTAPPALNVGARITSSSYGLSVQSLNTDDLYKWAGPLEKAIAAIPLLQDVNDDMEIKSPRVTLVLDRDKAARYGLSASEIENTMYSGLGPKWASTIYGPKSQYRVLLEVDPKDQETAESLQKIAFKTSQGALVPLESIMGMKETVGPQTVNHSGQLPAVTISFGLRPGVSLGTAIDAINEVAHRVLPPTVTVEFQGSAKAFQASMQNLGVLLFLAIGVVYIVLGMLYESYVHPITILSGLPSAGLGALVTLWLFGNELNIYSYVGLIMLVGIVKKNAIMQIDFALEAERHHGKTPAEAIREGCLIRFRPIMMTTMAALLGAMPLALGLGLGGEARQPLGLAIVGGLVISQLITLYLTPVVYTYMAALVKPRRVAQPFVVSSSQPA